MQLCGCVSWRRNRMAIELYVDGELVFEDNDGIEYDEDGVAWWFDEEEEIWYFYDEYFDDWFEWDEEVEVEYYDFEANEI